MSSRRSNPLSQINWELYFNNIKERAKAVFIYNDENGDSYYIYSNKKLTEKDFEKMFPLELVRINPKGENKDTTHVK